MDMALDDIGEDIGKDIVDDIDEDIDEGIDDDIYNFFSDITEKYDVQSIINEYNRMKDNSNRVAGDDERIERGQEKHVFYGMATNRKTQEECFLRIQLSVEAADHLAENFEPASGWNFDNSGDSDTSDN